MQEKTVERKNKACRPFCVSAVQRLPESHDAAAPAFELLQRLQPESDVPALLVRRLPLRQAAGLVLHQAVAITYGRGPGHDGRGRWPPRGSRRHLCGLQQLRSGASRVRRFLHALPDPRFGYASAAAAAARAARLHFGGHREVAPFHMGH